MSKKFVLASLGYAIIGLLLGVYMGATHNHAQLVAHAHILLAGFVLSFIYALCHKLWLNEIESALAKIQFGVHQLGVLALSAGLFLLYGGFVEPASLEAVLAAASVAVLAGMVLMALMFATSPNRR